MTTTIMRDSIVGDAWIQQTQLNVPIQRRLDENGADTGDIITGPVRLAFCDLLELPKATADSPNPKFGATLMFPPNADMTIFYEEFNKLAAQHFPEHLANGQYHGIHSPFHDQAEKMKFTGFTAGCVYVNAGTQYKPPLVDANMNPIVEASKVHAGVWAICSVNMYKFDNPKKKGISFGLQNVMIIGEDTNLGGGAPDSKKVFGAVQGAITAPAISAGQAGGLAGAPVANPPVAAAPVGAPVAPAHPAPPVAPVQPAPAPGVPGQAAPSLDDLLS